MRKLSLFSGIGGIDLAAHWAGMETVAFCEREPFQQAVLRKHWPDVPIYDDVCTLTADRLREDGILGDGRAIDIISAGYPCQGESYAGERRGAADDRWLWPETARLLDELEPPWFVGENVSGHITMGIDTVFNDLDYLQYTARAFHIPALAVDADHERYRVFVVAHSNKKSGLQANKAVSAIRANWEAWQNARRRSWRPIPRVDWGISGPPVSRKSNGIPNRVDRCYALGNAVSPYQVYPILATIKAINDSL
ncbi:DNA cytosine methyltransferase [Paenibacillus polymyxa]|uniref:DNA (cytosine-5-)-methyltransferase n=1 Tax=Paenibacillus polymyxa TaxID=1406 RepID=A0A8I1LNX5_PAEPO|nr:MULTISPECIES: DNA cytosine methyltransferase [Paenibacillus]KAF6576551.1 DNA cytosine methyltransferase [Paenibacillus sp. EKM206P]KAF6591315.1 DNA cytosine methyltransferase [Paenibacillus sp. EKM205P]MBM0632004.1 DNA cytosine methyltransferase [Paenibacillus polymyxa]